MTFPVLEYGFNILHRRFMKNLLLTLLVTLSFGASAKNIELSKKNTVILNEAFSLQSIAKLQSELYSLSKSLKEDEEITLVLDTPGGSVFAGLVLFDTVKSIPQKVNTLTLFAASMGYQTVQNLGDRYILPSGILMSHRAYLGGLKGQLNGELEERLQFYKDMTGELDRNSAARIGITYDEYKKLIINEYWAGATKALAENHVDEIVTANCDETLSGTHVKDVRTFFGSFSVEFSNCPLIRGPLRVIRGSRKAFSKYQSEYFSSRNLTNVQ
jgi:ATP-dependent Clp protease protease subunit